MLTSEEKTDAYAASKAAAIIIIRQKVPKMFEHMAEDDVEQFIPPVVDAAFDAVEKRRAKK